MKPDKKKESITEEYQRPPLLEEIKKFKEELKLVSSWEYEIMWASSRAEKRLY